MTDIQKMINLIEQHQIIGQTGKLVFDYAGLQTTVFSKDVLGNTIQDWFGQWLHQHDMTWQTGIHSQSWPDFILEDGSHLEVKTFDADASPNFDIANFDAFIRSLWDGHVHRLDTPHLVFSYQANPNTGLVTINDYWLKNLWALTGPSPTNILSLQVKQGSAVNIRPKNWRNPKVKLFNSRKEFVIALSQAIIRFRGSDYPNWLQTVEQHYLNQFHHPL